MERVFYTHGTAPRGGLGATVGSAGVLGCPARGRWGWLSRDGAVPAPRRGAPPNAGVVGTSRRRRSVGGRGVPWARGQCPGPTRWGGGVRPDPLTGERGWSRSPRRKRGLCVCVRARVRGFGLDIKQFAAERKKKKRVIFLPTFFPFFFFSLLPRTLIPPCGQTALLL